MSIKHNNKRNKNTHDFKMSKRECHPKFSESHTKKVEYHTNSKNPKYEIKITHNLVNSTQKKLKSTQNVVN
jgi:hypothetical protein